MKHKMLLIGSMCAAIGLFFLFITWIGIYQELHLCYKVWTHQTLSFLEDERGCYLYSPVISLALVLVPLGFAGAFLFKGIRNVQRNESKPQ